MTAIDFYFDPGCPWTWITSRWVVEVADARDLDVRWLTYSLRYKNRDADIPEQFRAPMERQYRALRVIEAARDRHGDGVVGALYAALGARIHHDGDTMLDDLEGAIAEAGLDASLLAVADDATWDEAIERSTDAGRALVGDDVGVPIIVVPDSPATYFGPVMSPAPTGEDALALWDAFTALGRFEGVYEVKRSREVGPQFGPRPQVSAP